MDNDKGKGTDATSISGKGFPDETRSEDSTFKIEIKEKEVQLEAMDVIAERVKIKIDLMNIKSQVKQQLKDQMEEVKYFIGLLYSDYEMLEIAENSVSNMYHRVPYFYTVGFFYRNMVEHAVLLDRRVITLLGMIYGYPFSKKSRGDTVEKISEFLEEQLRIKKNSLNYRKEESIVALDYSQDILLADLRMVAKRRNKSKVENLMDMGTHSHSKHIQYAVEGKAKILEGGRHSDERDFQIDIYSKHLYDIWKHIYDSQLLFKAALYILDENANNIKIEETQIFNSDYLVSRELDKEEFRDKIISLVNNVEQIGPKINSTPNLFLNGTFFTYNEVVYCLVSVRKLLDKEYYEMWEGQGVFLRDKIDVTYMVNCALLRTYTCYEKIIKSIKEADPVKYKVLRGIGSIGRLKDDGILTIKLKELERSQARIDLYKLRNSYSHRQLVNTFDVPSEGYNNHNNHVILTIIENLDIIFTFMEEILKIPIVSNKG